MNVALEIWAVEAVLFGVLHLKMAGRYKAFIARHGQPFKYAGIAPAALYVMDLFSVMRRAPLWSARLSDQMRMIYRSKHPAAESKVGMALILTAAFLVHLFIGLIGAADGGSPFFILASLGLAMLCPFILHRMLENRIEKIRRTVILEMPEFINKLTLLVNAGENVQKAMIRCARRPNRSAPSRLYEELEAAARKLENRYPFHAVMDELSKGCGVRHVSVFCATVMLNHRKGGEEFAAALKELSRELWEKRKSLARTLGEEASSKLVFPMVLIFIIVMVVVASPALMMIRSG